MHPLYMADWYHLYRCIITPQFTNANPKGLNPGSRLSAPSAGIKPGLPASPAHQGCGWDQFLKTKTETKTGGPETKTETETMIFRPRDGLETKTVVSRPQLCCAPDWTYVGAADINDCMVSAVRWFDDSTKLSFNVLIRRKKRSR